MMKFMTMAFNGSTSKRIESKCLRSSWSQAPGRRARRGFLLILVLIVLAIASLAAMNFSDSMLVSHESSLLDNHRLQARMMVESGLQTIRLFVSSPRALREESGGTWSNPQKFQAINIIANGDPKLRGNVTIVAPSLDQSGAFSGFRYGLENESAKLNLNALVAIDSIAQSAGGASGGAAGVAAGVAAGGAAGSGNNGAAASMGLSSLASAAAATGLADGFARNQLLKLPGMTEDVADAILDWIDEDDTPRTYGAEFADTYSQMMPPYRPANGPIASVEQLLLVRGVTPQLLFGYDQNRNGYIDAAEQTQAALGILPTGPGGVPQTPKTTMSGETVMPGPLGIAPYLTLHSQEKNVALDGSPRININGSDLQQLYTDLSDALGNELLASFIIAYRIGGQPPAGAGSPLQLLLSSSAAGGSQNGMMGAQLAQMAQGANPQGGQGAGQGGQQVQPWNPGVISSMNLAQQQGNVKFNQVLDLVDATVTIQSNNQPAVYASPVSGMPVSLAIMLPQIMDKLTTVDAKTIPGRINIMECPREILAGIPGMTEEIVDSIVQARVDGSTSENRKHETWLAAEGLVTIQQMRGMLPLVTCGGDVFKAQVIGYFEESGPFSRVEAIVNASGQIPIIQFYRRLDHLGRGFDIGALGQRFDVGVTPNVNMR